MAQTLLPLASGIELEVALSIPHPIQGVFRGLRPRTVRTYREFAEEEIVLPKGSAFPGPFSVDVMPWTGLVLDEFDRHRYRRSIATGPVQGGKTLLFFVTPILYSLFELEEPVIVGVPTIEMAHGIYSEKIEPSILESRYSHFVPKKGAGSRGGKFTMIKFLNGATLRFMGAGGGDEQVSSHTCKVVALSEIDKMDEAGASSRETDPVRQLERRADSQSDKARVFAECTISTKKGRVYQEVHERGTGTQAFFPCPFCDVYVAPERDGFVGYQDAENVIDARANAGWACSACGAIWLEEDRQEALRHPVLAAKGQTVSKKGVVSGDPPKTLTFGFTWNAMSSGLRTMADIAEDEYEAMRADSDSAMKAIHQFVWTLPWDDGEINLASITQQGILDKTTGHPRGVAPKGTDYLTVYVDLGLHTCWWVACAWRKEPEWSGHVIDYGPLDVPQERQPDAAKILSALRAFRDDTLTPGWICDGKQIVHDLCMIDAAWEQDITYKFVLESGQARYFAARGLGTTNKQKGWAAPKPSKDKRLGNEWYLAKQEPRKDGTIWLVLMHADHWKREVHRGFMAPPGAVGSLGLFKGEKVDHLQFVRQVTAEEQTEPEFKPGVGAKVYWKQIRRANHYLDACVGAHVAANIMRMRNNGKGGVPMPKPATKENADEPKRWKIGR